MARPVQKGETSHLDVGGFMKFLTVATAVALTFGSSAFAGEKQAKVLGMFAVCQCSRIEDGIAVQTHSVSGEHAASDKNQAVRLADAKCKNDFRSRNVRIEDCTYTQALEESINKNKTRYRIQKLLNDDEANLQADLMGTLD